MGAPVSLLGQARGFARDFARDQMPKGYLWDILDYVPAIIDAPLTGRGGWEYASTDLGADVAAGIRANFPSGERLLVVSDEVANRWFEISQTPPYTASPLGPAHRPSQNPVKLNLELVHVDALGQKVPQLISAPTAAPAPVVINDAHAAQPKARVATVYKARLVSSGQLIDSNFVWFSKPTFGLGDPNSYDALSFIPTSHEVTALASLRTMVLVFHNGSTERIRGDTPPTTPPDPLPALTSVLDFAGDMFLEPLFDHVGCTDPGTIAYWQDSVIFADGHGVHMTDGNAIRTLTAQGGISTYWRNLYLNRVRVSYSLTGCVYLDYYVVSMRLLDGSTVTLVCDLTRRLWYRFSNVKANVLFSGSSDNVHNTGVERCWAGLRNTHKLCRLDNCFFPTLDGSADIVDADGTPVLPQFETPWYKLGLEGRKRIRFAYLSYDAYNSAGSTSQVTCEYLTSPVGTSYGSAHPFPSTTEYTRKRMQVGKFPYGIAFLVKQANQGRWLRVFDLGIEAQGAERSRL